MQKRRYMIKLLQNLSHTLFLPSFSLRNRIKNSLFQMPKTFFPQDYCCLNLFIICGIGIKSLSFFSSRSRKEITFFYNSFTWTIPGSAIKIERFHLFWEYGQHWMDDVFVQLVLYDNRGLVARPTRPQRLMRCLNWFSIPHVKMARAPGLATLKPAFRLLKLCWIETMRIHLCAVLFYEEKLSLTKRPEVYLERFWSKK